MKIYNTLTRKVEEFIPNDKKRLICILVDLPFIIMHI